VRVYDFRENEGNDFFHEVFFQEFDLLLIAAEQTVDKDGKAGRMMFSLVEKAIQFDFFTFVHDFLSFKIQVAKVHTVKNLLHRFFSCTSVSRYILSR
jgi:hypothetical protein